MNFRAFALNWDEKGTGTSVELLVSWTSDSVNSCGRSLNPEGWDNGFRTQTGQNINVAANGIAKLLRMMIEEDD